MAQRDLFELRDFQISQENYHARIENITPNAG